MPRVTMTMTTEAVTKSAVHGRHLCVPGIVPSTKYINTFQELENNSIMWVIVVSITSSL